MTSTLPEVYSIGTSKEFDDYIKSPSIVNQVLLVHVELDQIPVCRTVNDALLALSRTDEFKANLSVCRLNADHFPEFLTSLHITAAPTVLFYHRTKLIDRVDGFNQSELIRKVQSYMKSIDFSQAVAEPTTSNATDVQKKIKDLLQSSPVILFMKGTPSNPQCGFSRQACHLLDEHQIKFNTFDVLSDPVLREQLKAFSNWNTYPQVTTREETPVSNLSARVDLVVRRRGTDRWIGYHQADDRERGIRREIPTIAGPSETQGHDEVSRESNPSSAVDALHQRHSRSATLWFHQGIDSTVEEGEHHRLQDLRHSSR